MALTEIEPTTLAEKSAEYDTGYREGWKQMMALTREQPYLQEQ